MEFKDTPSVARNAESACTGGGGLFFGTDLILDSFYIMVQSTDGIPVSEMTWRCCRNKF